MAIPTFGPPVAPSSGTSYQTTPSAIVSTFGDGYEQRVGIGLHRQRRVASVVWEVVSHADADELVATFAYLAGVGAFYYALAPEATQRTWVCETWSRSELGEIASSVSATFREVFDL